MHLPLSLWQDVLRYIKTDLHKRAPRDSVLAATLVEKLASWQAEGRLEAVLGLELDMVSSPEFTECSDKLCRVLGECARLAG